MYSPCGKYIVYPLGSFVVLKNVVTEKEAFFDGHTNEVSCVCLSADGNRMASGQINLMGVKVRFIITYNKFYGLQVTLHLLFCSSRPM